MDGCINIWNLFYRYKYPVQKSKTLLIGINYLDSENKSSKNINDAFKLKQFLLDRQYFDKNDITVMCDTANKNDKTFTSRKNIMDQLNELLNFARKFYRTTLFVAFSGRMINTGNKDSPLALLTSDGVITKDDIFNNFLAQLPYSTEIFMLFDTNQINPFFELKYRYNCDEKNTYNVIDQSVQLGCNGIVLNGCRHNDYLINLLGVSDKDEIQDDGALIYAFLAIYNERISIRNLILGIKQWFYKNNPKQIPNISSSKLLYINKITVGSLLKYQYETI